MRILTDLKNQENRVKGGDTRPFYLLFTEIKKEQGKISLKKRVSHVSHARTKEMFNTLLPT